jgi:hypothetical protein
MTAGTELSPLAQWHLAVERHDLSLVEPLIADDAVFFSPAIHTPQAGKAMVLKYLGAALVVLADPSFRYVKEWHAERSAILEFELELDGIAVNGIDRIEWNEDGKIVYFKVMVRPFKGLEKVIERMGKQLATT